MGLLFARAAAAAVMALFRPILARPLSRSVANVPLACCLAGVRGTGAEEEEAPQPPQIANDVVGNIGSSLPRQPLVV